MPLTLELQNDDGLPGVPDSGQFERWVEASLQRDFDRLEQVIRVVGLDESEALNARYRGRQKPTNVLSFPAGIPHLDYDCLGDLVICAPLVAAEALQQGKPVDAHWAHLVVHGMLHLQGLDHQVDAQATRMEALEVEVLDTLGYTNPYNA